MSRRVRRSGTLQTLLPLLLPVRHLALQDLIIVTDKQGQHALRGSQVGIDEERRDPLREGGSVVCPAAVALDERQEPGHLHEKLQVLTLLCQQVLHGVRKLPDPSLHRSRLLALCLCQEPGGYQRPWQAPQEPGEDVDEHRRLANQRCHVLHLPPAAQLQNLSDLVQLVRLQPTVQVLHHCAAPRHHLGRQLGVALSVKQELLVNGSNAGTDQVERVALVQPSQSPQHLLLPLIQRDPALGSR
mmetsp:Transcript_19813/g.45202  ORF Transcript_19813/g.45202 Transcript_19813/m.45202 type:complete len:243 (+) Transcript_19813:701-1429(+)